MQSIRSVNIRSCARIVGATYGAMGLIFSPFFVIASLIAAAFGNHAESALTLAGGIAAAVVMPILYGGLGFVVGALGAWVYNMVAHRFGGIEIELQDIASPGNPSSRLGLV